MFLIFAKWKRVKMDSYNIKSKVLSGLIWKFAERISAQLVTFVVSIALARILSPSHYGAIAIVNIFIALANVFVVNGFGNSLIQKKDADDTDFSSVFYFNILLSLGLYIIVFFSAPFIAEFYKMPILSPVLRFMGLRLIVAGINSVQHAYVAKKMLFKRFFWSTLGGTVASGTVGIIMAYQGYGIWALAAQYMTNTTVDTIVLWFTVKWRPKLSFSFKSLGGMFSYGWKILVSSLIQTIYSKFKSLIIGKLYTPEDLAYYSKGDSFPSLIVTNIDTSIQSVLFPAMANIQDKKEQVKLMIRRSIRISSYIMFPMMMGMAIIAEPLIKLLLTEKWLLCVPYLQISCLVYGLMPIHTANLQAINAIGRSDIFLKIEIIKKIIGITAFFLAVKYGVWAVAVSGAVVSLITSFVNAFPNKKLFGYGYISQIKDLIPAIMCSVIMGIVVGLMSNIALNPLALMLIQLISGIIIYVAVSMIFKIESFYYILQMIKNILPKQKKREEIL